MKTKIGLRAAAVAIAAVLALTGCTAQSSDSSTGAPAKTSLSLSTQSPTSDMSVGNFSGGDPTIVFAVYDRLVTQSLTGELVPSVAESWAYGADNSELTFKIRSGQTFSNGEKLDAAAVVASIEASRAGAGSAPQLASIESVEAVDAATVDIKLSRPDAGLIYQLAGTPGIIGAPASIGSEDAKLKPIGSGPYVLDADAGTVGSVYQLKKNPDYWNADAYPFETVKMTVIADPTAVQNAMKTGQIDFAPLASADLASQFPDTEFTIGDSLPSTLAGLFITDRAGTVVPALADVRVRQAINLAIDRNGIAEKLIPGNGEPTAQVASPLGKAYDPALNDTYAYNVDKAKKLMSDAGYAAGFSVTMPSTVLSQTFDSTLAQQLAAIGITVNYETVPFQDLYSKLYAGAYGIFFFFNGYSGSDAKDLTQVLSGAMNPQATMTPELQQLLDTANSASADDQADSWAAVNKYYVDNGWFAPVTYSTGKWVSTNTISYTPSIVYGDLLAYAPAK